MGDKTRLLAEPVIIVALKMAAANTKCDENKEKYRGLAEFLEMVQDHGFIDGDGI